MSIEVAIVNENHEVEQMLRDSNHYLSYIATEQFHNLNNTACLQFIDPYGDTVFNQSQLPILLAELTSLTFSKLEPKIEEHLKAVCSLVENAQNKIHTYVKFIGD